MSLQDLSKAIENGKRNDAKAITQALLDAGTAPIDIVEQGLVPGMGTIGEKFKNNEVFVPEMLIAARAMKEAMAMLEPLLAAQGIAPKHRVVIGTVQGDLHDIGKNLVAMMLKGANFGVIDLGTNVSPEAFVAAAKEHDVQVIGLSTLLTTTMAHIPEFIELLTEKGLREKYLVVVGGAPLTAEFAEKVGADGFAPDAAQAVELVKRLLQKSA